MLTINNAIVMNEKTSKIYNFFVFQVTFVSLKFARILFVRTVFVTFVIVSSITSSCIIAESSVILSKYSPFSKVHVEGFQV